MTDDTRPRRLRILHLGFEDHRRPGSGGGSIRNQQVNRRLAERHDITVLTTNYPGARRRVEDGVTYVPIGLSRGYVLSLLSYFLALPFQARKYPADLVVEEFAAPISSILVPAWTRRPTLALVQWLNSREKSRQYRLPFSIFERTGVGMHRHFVAVSEDLQERLQEMNPCATVEVVPNGVEPLAFEVREPRTEDIVFLGRLEQAQKGLDMLLDAYARIADRVGGRLVLAGDGPDRARLAAQADRLGISARVVFTGRVVGERKYRLLAGARLVAMPSRFETFGMVAVEALAAGTPVVAFEIPCLRAVVPPACGVLVPSFDVAAYAAALERLHAEPETCDAMGSAGRTFARFFDWDRISIEQEQAYQAAAGQPPSSRLEVLRDGGRAWRRGSRPRPGRLGHAA